MDKVSKSKLVTIFGGQFGSEGKGQVASFLGQRSRFDYAVRVGGPNAGHTYFYANGRRDKVQSVPVAAMLGSIGVIGPAGVILPQLLLEELQRGFTELEKPIKLMIDSNAVVITPEHMDREVEMKKSIGSTGEGVGAATADKVMRTAAVALHDNPALNSHLLQWLVENDSVHAGRAVKDVYMQDDTSYVVNRALTNGYSVMLEGTQGFGLGLHTGGFYPFCTSRESTPAALWAETGVNPGNADNVETVMVVRTHPIRVGGNSGPLANEISWEELKRRTRGYVAEPEITTVTKKVRRIADIDYGLLERAVLQTRPTSIALMFLDYVFPEVSELRDPSGLQRNHWQYITDLEQRLDVPIKIVGCGPNNTLSLRITQ